FSGRAGKIALVTGALFTAFCMSACAGSTDVTTTVLNRDGSVRSIIIDSFDKDYYKVEELESMAGSRADEYNGLKGADSVKVGKVSEKEGKVTAELSFDSWEDYAGFNGVTFFVGTVKEARDAGYEIPESLDSADGSGSVISAFDLVNEHGDNHVVITDETVRLKTFSKILYSGEGVTLLSSKEAEVNEGIEGPVYLVFK
ncbi:MAG: hypothetical protein K6E33_08440, partial [Lachnospiraceae bacterium]|nr:hypothetical protein [Lachnospiraceae bacterium]